MFDCATGQGKVCVGKDGDYADAVDAVDVGDDLNCQLHSLIRVQRTYSLHGKVPILVHERLIPHGEQGDLPRLDRRRSRIHRKQFDIQGIQIVCIASVSN